MGAGDGSTDRSAGAPGSPPDAPLVLAASEDPAASLAEATRAGWSGPVVVVPSLGDARALRAQLGASSARHPGGARERLELDLPSRTLRHGATAVELTELESGMIEVLLRRPGQVVRYAVLGHHVWGSAHLGDPSPIPAVLARLRRKLRGAGLPVQVRTLRSIGLRAVVQPQVQVRRVNRP